jgi:hypothetical protein
VAPRRPARGTGAVFAPGFAALTLALLAALLVPFAASAHGTAEGTLTLKVSGLPRGEHAALLLTGPKAGTHGDSRLHRRLEPRAPRATLSLGPGHYRLTVEKLRLRRSHGAVKAGATALPTHRHLKVTVKSGETRKVDVVYGSIVNPGVRDVSNAIARVLGDPERPRGVALRPGVRVRHGQILSARPSAQLPNGLLARAVAVSGRARQQVVLQAASIYEVAPNFSFDVPVTVTEGAEASTLVKCATSAGIDPFVHLSNFRVSGGWSTTHLGPFDVKTGATAELHFHAAAGLNVTTTGALSCSLSLPAIGFQGMAGPIPVYGGVRPGASVDVGASATLKPEISTDITIGAKASGVPPRAAPILGFGSPSAKLGGSVFAGVKAGLSVGAELGIGAIDAANLHVDLTNSLDFTAAPGQCSWDLDLGAFSATGEVGPLSISTPSSPAIHKNLWHAACGNAPAPPPPAAAPSAVTLPLTRATMSWDTDSDIDLYTWDSQGNVLYYEERDGIPNAELVEDVIPAEGEFSHPAEVFRETAEPDRPYTFGICDFHGEGADVTLSVTDPGGTVRTFHRTLEYEGDSAVITSSPLGPDYSPPYEWCQYLNEYQSGE